MSALRLGVDVGGTFTDLVALGGGDIKTAKVPSTPARPVGGRDEQRPGGGGRGWERRGFRARHDGRHERAVGT